MKKWPCLFFLALTLYGCSNNDNKTEDDFSGYQFTVMDAAKGLLFFSSEGETKDRIDLNPPYTYINGLNRPVYAFGNELAYIRPERGEMDWNNLSEMFENIYRSPILEVYNPKTKTYRNTMPFPPGTVYEDGNFTTGCFLLLFLQERSGWCILGPNMPTRFIKKKAATWCTTKPLIWSWMMP